LGGIGVFHISWWLSAAFTTGAALELARDAI
jgi:hypothetical protein